MGHAYGSSRRLSMPRACGRVGRLRPAVAADWTAYAVAAPTACRSLHCSKLHKRLLMVHPVMLRCNNARKQTPLRGEKSPMSDNCLQNECCRSATVDYTPEQAQAQLDGC